MPACAELRQRTTRRLGQEYRLHACREYSGRECSHRPGSELQDARIARSAGRTITRLIRPLSGVGWPMSSLRAVHVREVRDEERDWLRAAIVERWGDEIAVGRGRVWTLHELPAMVAVDDSGNR